MLPGDFSDLEGVKQVRRVLVGPPSLEEVRPFFKIARSKLPPPQYRNDLPALDKLGKVPRDGPSGMQFSFMPREGSRSVSAARRIAPNNLDRSTYIVARCGPLTRRLRRRTFHPLPVSGSKA